MDLFHEPKESIGDWISVKERRPQVDDCYKVKDEEYPLLVIDAYYSFSEWWDKRSKNLIHVTHWKENGEKIMKEPDPGISQ